MNTHKTTATWNGSIQNGKGTMKIDEVNENLPYNYLSRFGDGKGTNPEELIAAAHAGCYSMALSSLLSKKGYKVNSIDTDAQLKLEKQEDGFRIIESNLTTHADIPEIDETLFMKMAVNAKVNCPVSQALTGVKINMHAYLDK